MNKNIGLFDKTIRLVLASILGMTVYLGYVEGILATILVVLTLTLSVSAIFRYCPIYQFLGINTTQNE